MFACSHPRHPAILPTLIALATLATLAAAATPAPACSCLEPPSVEAARAASAAVFTGFPRSVTSAEPAYADMVWVMFDVAAIWKGVATPQFAVLTPENDARCGVSFELGVEWLVYAQAWGAEPGAPAFTHLCSRTARATGNPDLDALGPPIATPAVARSWGLLKSIYR